MVFLPRGIRGALRLGRRVAGENGIKRQRTAKGFEDICDPRFGCVVGGINSTVVDKCIRDNLNPPALVIKNHDRAGDLKKHVRDPEFVLRRLRDRRFEPAHAIVAEVTDRASAERGKLRIAGNPESLHPALEFIQRIALRSKNFREPAIGERHGFSGRGERGLSTETDKRIPPDLVILLRGFEKKRRRAPAQLGKCGDRRVAVRNNLGPDRHDPCCRRLLRKGGS